jgi:4-amino-4-deoxy-L-arabinose transferase-like glycosyltransferase
VAQFIAKKNIFWIIVISTSIRLLLATLLELGNDEVYYWTYALYPDLSHFDHPPMVGLVIQLFTLNGLLKDDFFMRLGPIVFSAFNTSLIFILVRKISDERAGLYASILYNASIYFFIISGFAIIPDAPLVLFWLLSLMLMVDVLPASKIDREARWKMILFGGVAGLAILSKYQGAFIWVGACYSFFFTIENG